MTVTLPDNIWSREDLKAVILEVKTYARWFGAARIKQQISPANKTVEPPMLSGATAGLLRQAQQAKQLSQASIDELLQQLQTIQNTLPEITITLAAPASMSLKKDLVIWCRQNIAASILVNFRFNTTLLGGMVVHYKSRIFDWSFRKEILAKRHAFPEVLRHV